MSEKSITNLLVPVFIFIVLISHTAFAQENSTSKLQSDTTEIQYVDSFKLKSESHAFKSSLYGTLVPLPTIVFTIPGLVFGPSLGYFYGGMLGRAWKGIAIRSAGVIGMASAIAWSFSDFDFGDNNSNSAGAGILFVTSASVIVFSAIYDIAKIKKAVRKSNAALSNARLDIIPKYFSQTNSVGISLNLHF